MPPQHFPLSALIRSHRHAADLSLEELAERSGVSVRAISDIERGHSRGPQARTIEALADALTLAGQERTALLAAARAGRRSRDLVLGLCDLPPATPDFAGREPERSWLLRDAGASRVSIVSGGPGLGKTTLAVHSAWQAADQFSEGRFFVDLRGLDTDPADPQLILGRLLRALSVQEQAIPAQPDERQVLYRRLMRDRHVLIVLDNVAYEAQLRPLLPGPGHGAVWATSRRALTGIEHARRLPLQPLPADSAASMLAAILDTRDRAAGDDTALHEIADRCGNLPLALRIAGNRLLTRPSWSTRDLADRLAAEDVRLDRLTAGDLHVQTAFTLSYKQLTPPVQTMFRRLSLVPGSDFGPALAAVLTGLPLHQAEQMVDELIELGLLVPTTGDRAAFHDLIRLYARQRLRDEETPDAGSSARARMEHWLLDTACAAGAWFEPGHDATPHDDPLAALDGQQAAQHWLDTESHNWFSAFQRAAQTGRHRTVVNVAESMHWFSDWCVFWGHWHEVFALSTAAAHELGDLQAEAVHLNYQAWSERACLGDFTSSETHALQAEELARQAGDKAQQAWAFNYAALAAADMDRIQDALTYGERAVDLFREAGDKEGLPQALKGLAHALAVAQRPEESLERLRQIMALMTDPAWAPAPHLAELAIMNTWRLYGNTHASARDWTQAVTAYRRALETGPKVNVANIQALTCHGLGRALYQLHEHTAAHTAMEQARTLFLATGNTTKLTEVDTELRNWTEAHGTSDR